METVYKIFGSAISIYVISVLLFAVIVLLIFLFRKHKALELSKFTMSLKGVELTFEINKDKRMEILVLENITLNKEIEILKDENKNKNNQVIGLLLIMLVILVISRIKSIFK